jgi:hypothetical protein
MPPPDAEGGVVLFGPKPEAGLLLAFGAGFALVSATLWIFRTSVVSDVACIMLFLMAVFLLAGGLRNLTSVPVRLEIGTSGLIYTNPRGRVQRMQWEELREVRLVSVIEPARGQPIGRPKSYVTTRIFLLTAGARLNWLQNFGIGPRPLAAYVLARQHSVCPEQPAILEDQTVAADPPQELMRKDSVGQTFRSDRP